MARLAISRRIISSSDIVGVYEVNTEQNTPEREDVINDKNDSYKKVVNLLFEFHSKLYGSCNYIRGSELSNRQSRIIVKNYGNYFAPQYILFAETFLLFAGDVATKHILRFHCFQEAVCKDHMLKLSQIKRIEYSAMPLHKDIWIVLANGSRKRLYDGLPAANSYSDVRAYAKRVESGEYKRYTIWLVAVIYALKALSVCAVEELNSKYEEIRENLSELLACCQQGKDSPCFYGKLISFDFVKCVYSAYTVEKDLDKICVVAEEAKDEAKAEKQERIAEAVTNHVERIQIEYEKRKNNDAE